MSAITCGCDREAHYICKDQEEMLSKLVHMDKRPRVIIESPLSAKTREGIEQNKRYARICMRHSLLLGEAPFASHVLYDHYDILDDLIDLERQLGMTAGFEWIKTAHFTAAYIDLGYSRGMELGIERARQLNKKVEFRQLGPGWDK